MVVSFLILFAGGTAMIVFCCLSVKTLSCWQMTYPKFCDEIAQFFLFPNGMEKALSGQDDLSDDDYVLLK